MVAGLALLFARLALSAQGQSSATNFFLPKIPSRPRMFWGGCRMPNWWQRRASEFVYVALLQRPGLERKYPR